MTVYTGGTFDLFHVGHVRFLARCKKITGHTGKVVVALNTDKFVTKFKGRPPIYNYAQRSSILISNRFVDEVIENKSGANSKPTIKKVKPDFIVIGDDWAKKDYYAQMGFTQKWLDEQGIDLVYVPYTQGISSSIIKDHIKNAK